MRRLATIQKILAIRPIPGADMIEAIDVLGWTVVAQKGQHKVGDLVVYFEVDSFLNANDPRYASFEERFTNWGDKRGMRLKTIKLRKQLSQGLILPVRNFPELYKLKVSGTEVKVVNENGTTPLMYAEDDDVTEVLKIEKWEPLHETQSNAGGQNARSISKPFPSFIRKTDQERVQNRIAHLSRVADKETFEATIKLDGSSMTIYHLNNTSPYFDEYLAEHEARHLRRKKWHQKLWHHFKKKVGLIKKPTFIQGVCSRNLELDLEDSNHFSAYVRQYKLLDDLLLEDQNIAVQGELISPSIQENYEQMNDVHYFVYDIFDIDKQQYMKPADTRALVKKLCMNHVPVLDENFEISKVYTKGTTSVDWMDYEQSRSVVDNILAYAEGPGMNPGVKREGVVFKSNQSDFSFKAISNSYLLKKGKE